MLYHFYRADRPDHPPPEQLQAETVDYAHSRHGTHGEDDPNYSQDNKERVKGPLAGKGKK
jgi:hypothetical protein